MSKSLIVIGIALAAAGCSDGTTATKTDTSTNENVSSQETVWKQQTDALNKAKDLNKALEEAHSERVKQLEDEVPEFE